MNKDKLFTNAMITLICLACLFLKQYDIAGMCVGGLLTYIQIDKK